MTLQVRLAGPRGEHHCRLRMADFDFDTRPDLLERNGRHYVPDEREDDVHSVGYREVIRRMVLPEDEVLP